MLYQKQCEFRDLHFTEMASLEITDIIAKYLDNGTLPIGIFSDLWKACDTSDHCILLKMISWIIVELEIQNWPGLKVSYRLKTICSFRLKKF